MRTITVVYGPAYEADSMLKYGGDVYVETSPRQWSRMVDLPNGHPVCLAASQGTLKAASIFMLDGTLLPALNALDPEHRELAAKEGLMLDASGLSSSAKKYSSPSSDGYNEMMNHLEDVRRQLQQQTRNASPSDKNDLLNRVNLLREKVNALENDDAQQKLTFMQRLNELMQKIQDTKNEDYEARRAYLKMRVAKLQQTVAKMAEDEEYLNAESAFKTPKNIGEEFMQATRKLNLKTSPHMAKQLERLFAAHSITDFEDYFGHPENMAQLRKLAGLGT